jgi:hypothetical protein
MIDQELLRLLGVPENITPERAAYITKRVYTDNEILLVAEKLAREAFVCAAVRALDPQHFQRFVKRIQPEQVQPEPAAAAAGHVSWGTTGGTYSGMLLLHGHCSRCGQSVDFGGSPDAAAKIVWAHCILGPSRPPEHAVEDYKNAFGKVAAK